MKQDNKTNRAGIEQHTITECLEVELILSAVNTRYGYDFSRYSRDSLVRRLHDFRESQELSQLSDMLPKLLWDEHFFSTFLANMTIGVTEFFRDVDFFHAFKEHVIPNLSTFPYLKVWHAGCSTGEEVYSVAMLLETNDLLERSIMYATDINNTALDIAQSGIYPLKAMKQAEPSSKQILGNKLLSDYHHTFYARAKMDEALLSKITFSYHNLVSDKSFGQMNVICCRNVLIYFDRTLQDRALQLFSQSLRHGGFLCLGKGESLFHTAIQNEFSPIDLRQRIYRKRPPNMREANET